MQNLMKLQNGSDIRGIACEGVAGEEVNLTPEAGNLIGQAFAIWLGRKKQKAVTDLRIGIGHDSRITAQSLYEAVAKGLTVQGATAYYCGLVSTPSMFMTTVFEEFAFDGAIMITASHLPFNRNGYKFFDRDGNTLVLRPDITPQIARATATLFKDDELPARLCYVGNTFINHSSYQGRLKESTQMGAEMIGLDAADADAEMLALVIDCLKNAGLEEFQISIGNVDFFQSLIEESEIDDETEERLRELINNRNFFGADELLEEADAKPVSRKAFSALSELVWCGDPGGGEKGSAKQKSDESNPASRKNLRDLICLQNGTVHYV